MNRRRVDAAAGVFLATILVAGGALAWQASRQRDAVDGTMGSMMDSTMGSMHGPDPLWIVFGTLLITTVLGAVYLLVRPEITTAEASGRSTDGHPAPETRPDSDETTRNVDASDATEEASKSKTTDAGSTTPEANPTERVLDLLPEDERRILEPILESPGITQIELRDRADFSKSKVSQTVSDLEKRGLLARERQGRTYRIYPSDDLHADREE